MSRRYTKVARERAAILCSAAAASPGQFAQLAELAIELDFDVYFDSDRLDYVGNDMPAVELASEAWLEVADTRDEVLDVLSPLRDAEAHAMIMTGWSPS